MNERKKAHDALEHALAAADDRMGQKFNHHLTVIGQGLAGVNANAHRAYFWALSWVQTSGVYYTEQTQIVRAMRKLAPVMLDLYLDKRGIE